MHGGILAAVRADDTNSTVSSLKKVPQNAWHPLSSQPLSG